MTELERETFRALMDDYVYELCFKSYNGYYQWQNPDELRKQIDKKLDDLVD